MGHRRDVIHVVTVMTFVERSLGRQFAGVAGYCMIAFVHIRRQRRPSHYGVLMPVHPT